MHAMFRTCLLLAATLLCACAATPRQAAKPAPHAVVLVSIDAMPAVFVGTGLAPAVDAIAREGTRADWLDPSYPTLTFPNHYTLVTGLRPDHHGIVHNNMRDARLGTFRSKGDSARDGRWWGGEAVWATLQRQGGIAATMFWPGSEAQIAGQRPRYFRAFDKTMTADARVDQVLAWLDLPPAARPALVTLYLDQYDVAAHEHGARSPEALAALRGIDAALARLQSGLSARGRSATTDLIVVSDHGMADSPYGQIRFLDDVRAPVDYDVRHWGQVIGIDPKPGHDADVARAFAGQHDHYSCWDKARLPPAWHYGSNPRVPAIICQADAGWRVQLRSHEQPTQAVKGEHGYAPEDPAMHAVFVATGPSFRQARLPHVDNINVYALLAHLLGIRPAPNQGDVRAFAPALREAQH